MIVVVVAVGQLAVVVPKVVVGKPAVVAGQPDFVVDFEEQADFAEQPVVVE